MVIKKHEYIHSDNFCTALFYGLIMNKKCKPFVYESNNEIRIVVFKKNIIDNSQFIIGCKKAIMFYK